MSNERVRVRGLSIHRPVIYGNTAVVLTQEERQSLASPDHTHRWTVALRGAASIEDSDIVGGADDISHFIKRVTFKLHDTYTNPSRNIDKPPFEVSETGWGEFEVQIRITFVPESGEKAIAFYHHLKLHPWTVNPADPEIPPLETAMALGPVHSWQYDEIVFNDPFQPFLNVLVQHPPSVLPKSQTRPVPFHAANANAGALEKSRGGMPEFTQEMEKEEADRLDAAIQVVLKEQDRWKAILLEKEKTLESLKEQLGED